MIIQNYKRCKSIIYMCLIQCYYYKKQVQIAMSQASTKVTNTKSQNLVYEHLLIEDLIDLSIRNQQPEESEEMVHLDYELRALKSRINPKVDNIVPIMATIKGSASKRTNVDMICVLDVSGSMSGKKLRLLKQTITYMLEILEDNDRFSLITFSDSAHQYINLRQVNAQFRTSASFIIESLHAHGGTDICCGLECAIKTIKNRKTKNEVTSIFLLSDGQDNNATKNVEKLLGENQMEPYSIHSFGFGDDHDEKIMTKISQLKNGGFYYIKEYNTLDQAFSSALGAMISVVLEKISIQISLLSDLLATNIKLKKCYGPFWKIKDNTFSIDFSHLISQISKDFVMQIEIPAFQNKQNKFITILQSFCVGKKADKIFEWHKEVTLALGEEDGEQDGQVLENYVRVTAVEQISRCKQMFEQGKLEQAKSNLRDLSEKIRNNPQLRPQKMLRIVLEIENLIKYSTFQQNERSGSKIYLSSIDSMLSQNGFFSSNSTQTNLIQKSRQRISSVNKRLQCKTQQKLQKKPPCNDLSLQLQMISIKEDPQPKQQSSETKIDLNDEQEEEQQLKNTNLSFVSKIINAIYNLC